MAVHYKTITKGKPGVKSGGTKKHYATIVTKGERNIEQLTKSMEKISTVSGADIRAVLYALVDVIPDSLAEGEIVRLGDLGSFRLSLSSTGEDSADEVTISSINGARIIFTPGPKLKEMLKNLVFQKQV